MRNKGACDRVPKVSAEPGSASCLRGALPAVRCRRLLRQKTSPIGAGTVSRSRLSKQNQRPERGPFQRRESTIHRLLSASARRAIARLC